MSENSGFSKNNVNTTGPRLKGEQNALMVDFWNKRISLGIARKLSTSEVTEDQFQYDWKNPIKVTISYSDVVRLFKGIEKLVSNTGKKSVGIDIVSGGKNYIIRVTKEVGEKANSYALSIDKEIDQSTRIAKGSVVFPFKNEYVISDYDPASGKNDLDFVESEFEIFYKSLKEFIESGTMASYHTFTEGAKYQASKNMGALAKIAGALNVDLGFSASNGGGKSSGIDWTGGSDYEDNDDVPF